MTTRKTQRRRIVLLLLALALMPAACGVPAEAEQAVRRAQVTEAPAPAPTATLATPAATPTPAVVSLTVASSGSQSQVTVRTVSATPTPLPTPLATFTISATAALSITEPLLAEPVIFRGLGFEHPCGHADIVAYDGHVLRATPRLLLDNSNFYERMAEGTQVKLIDCRLWTDLDDLTWAAVQTDAGKLGWILIQPDSVYVTIYPIVQAPPPALTGLPAGTLVAYVPPSACRTGPVTHEGVATSIGVDLIPVVGDVKGLAEAGTGCDLVTGEPLGDWRWFGLLGVVGLSEVGLLRHGDGVTDAARLGGNLDTVADNAEEAGSFARHTVDKVGAAAKAVGKVDGLTDEGIDAARLMENGSSWVEEAALLAAKFEQPCSFSADTLVHTAAGVVPISQVAVGDMALAFHEQLGATDFYTVTNVFAHLDPVVITLAVDGAEIATTPEHPFYVDDAWVAARDLAVGDSLSTLEDAAVVQAVAIEQQPQVMYNLTVADAHTYFVGEDGLLVHNACARALRKNLGGHTDAWTKDAPWQAHHVIPGKFEEHAFVQRARKAGWDIDGASNGVALPVAPAIDAGGNPIRLPISQQMQGRSVSTIESRLDDLEAAATKGNWTDQKARGELEKLVQVERTNIAKLPIPRLPAIGKISENSLSPEARNTVRRIDQGGSYPFAQDGMIFRNQEGLLPQKPDGYYREFTVAASDAPNRGMVRIVQGAGGELYYTDDHYHTFLRIAR